MKFTTFLGSFLCLVFLALAGCSSETESAIDNFEKVVDKGIAIGKNMTQEEMAKSPEMVALKPEFEEATKKVEALKDKFTPEQKARLEAIAARAAASGKK